MECCDTKKEDGCCKDLKKTEMNHSSKNQMKGGNFKMESKTILWVVIGIIFLFALYFVFQAGSGAATQSIGSAAGSAASTASSQMVGGC